MRRKACKPLLALLLILILGTSSALALSGNGLSDGATAIERKGTQTELAGEANTATPSDPAASARPDSDAEHSEEAALTEGGRENLPGEEAEAETVEKEGSNAAETETAPDAAPSEAEKTVQDGDGKEEVPTLRIEGAMTDAESSSARVVTMQDWEKSGEMKQEPASTFLATRPGMRLATGPRRVAPAGGGTITYHYRYDDGNNNYASVFNLKIDGKKFDGVCADGKNWTNGEPGMGCSLQALSMSSPLAKLGYLESIDYWNRGSYKDLDYKFGLVNASRKLNGKAPSYERYDSRTICERMMNDANSYRGAIPNSFRAYLAQPDNGGQIILAWGYAPTGELVVNKSAGKDGIIVKACSGTYALAGAVYTVYNSNDSVAGTMTTGTDGKSNKLTLEPGHYTVKETRAPNGYTIDPNTYSVTVNADQVSTVASYDIPVFASVSLVLEKKADGESYLNQGDMSGAEFEVCYYDTMADDAAALNGRKAVRTWKLKTLKDESGKYTASLDADHALPGSDPFFESEDDGAVIPRGTVTIRETRAPKGYHLDKAVRILKVDGSAGEKLVFNSGEPSVHVDHPAVPKICTSASDQMTGEELGACSDQAILVDKVSYEGLWSGETYRIRGTLMDQSSGKPILVGGKPVTTEKEFTVTPENSDIADEIASGKVDVEFVLDTRGLAGRTTVVFEKLIYNDKEIASHEDLKDQGQTIRFPKICTSASSEVSGDHLGTPMENEKIVDQVDYSNLTPGKEYTVTGILMDKETGKAIVKKVDGKDEEVTSKMTFVPEKSEGTVKMEFITDSRERQDHETVVFEDLYRNDVKIASHSDLNDEEQTIRYPKIGTTMTGEGKAKVVMADTKTSLTDEIRYENLIPGKVYTMKGKMMVKSSGQQMMQNGEPVVGTTTFIPETSSGTTKVKFTMGTVGMEKQQLVAYEAVYDSDGHEVARHEDLNSASQTVGVGRAPKTGDTMHFLGSLLILLGALEALALLTIRKRCGRL